MPDACKCWNIVLVNKHSKLELLDKCWAIKVLVVDKHRQRRDIRLLMIVVPNVLCTRSHVQWIHLGIIIFIWIGWLYLADTERLHQLFFYHYWGFIYFFRPFFAHCLVPTSFSIMYNFYKIGVAYFPWFSFVWLYVSFSTKIIINQVGESTLPRF